MKTQIIFWLCIILAVTPARAQWGNSLKNKIINKVENKADEKVDQAVNSAVDKPVDKTEEKVKESVKNSGESEESEQPPSSSEDMSKYMQMMGYGNISIEDYPDLDNIQPSSFVGSFDIHIESVKNGKKVENESATIQYYIDKYDVAFIPQTTSSQKQPEMRMIIHRKKGTMSMLTNNDGKKTGFVMKMQTITVDLAGTEFEDDMENTTVKVYKGERRNINGYNCYKVVAYNDKFESETWVTEDIDINMAKLFDFMNVQAKGQKNPYAEKFGNITGMAIESTSTDKKTGVVSIMTIDNVVEGKVDASMFSEAGYDLMAMPGF